MKSRSHVRKAKGHFDISAGRLSQRNLSGIPKWRGGMEVPALPLDATESLDNLFSRTLNEEEVFKSTSS